MSGRTFRYLLFRAARGTSKTVIFDGGGPGFSNLSNISVTYEQVAADAQARGFNLLVLDEPWVVAPDDPACRSAMASFYRESKQRYPRAATGGAVTSMRRACLSGDSATNTADNYRDAVGAIERTEGVSVVRLEGYSFASVRAAYLGAVRPNLIAAVSSPFPVGAKAADFFTAQGTAARTLRGAVKGSGWVPDSALAYYTITGTLPKDMDQATAARGLWQVDSAGDMSLSRVGYYSEICAALTDWAGLAGVGHQAGSAVAALASVHAACATENQPATLKLPAKTCFAVLASDPNSPWVPSLVTRRAHIETVAKGEHGKVKIPGCQ
ncbi:hypothetical protein [Krasilnikovia sp. M28-CT-15]|uniref:hypothetical protein n=1 Tax=Krasilnikovia sp. M28-CT-15 TaxID=3373540 RepID=UPI00399D2335